LHLLGDFDAGLLSVSAGAALHSFDGDLYYATNINRRTGDSRLSIPAGTSAVWYDFDAREIVVGSDPGEPSLQIGTVDASAETVDESVNRTRDVAFGSISTGERFIDRLGTYSYDGSDASIPGDDKYYQVALNQNRFDDRDDFNGQNDSIDISVDGRYVIRAVVQWKEIPNGVTVETEVRRNGGRIAVTQTATGASVFPTVPAQTEIDLTAGDSITMYTKQDSGSSIDYDGSASGTYLSIRQVG
jgi:hypothetical protein